MAIKPVLPSELIQLPQTERDDDQLVFIRQGRLYRAPVSRLPIPDVSPDLTFLQVFDLEAQFPQRFYQEGYVVRLFQNGAIGPDLGNFFSTGVPIGIDAGQIEGTNQRRVIHRGIIQINFNYEIGRLIEGFFPRPVYHQVVGQYPLLIPFLQGDLNRDVFDPATFGEFNPAWRVGYVIGKVQGKPRNAACYIDFGTYNVFDHVGGAFFDEELEGELRTRLALDNLDLSFVQA